MTILLVDIQIFRMCVLYVQYIYISIQYAYISVQYLFLMQIKCYRLKSTVFGSVYSNRTVVVLLHKHFSSWLSTFYNSINIIKNCMYTTMNKSNITTIC